MTLRVLDYKEIGEHVLLKESVGSIRIYLQHFGTLSMLYRRQDGTWYPEPNTSVPEEVFNLILEMMC